MKLSIIKEITPLISVCLTALSVYFGYKRHNILLTRKVILKKQQAYGGA